MRAIVQRAYGSATQVLELGEVDVPTLRTDEVLVRVRAASVHPDVWHVVEGLPYVIRLFGNGLTRPKRLVPGSDLAGVVEAEDEVLGLQLQGEFNSFSVSALGLLPLGNFDLFARGGIARWEGSLNAPPFGVEVSEDNTDPLFGFGAQYRTGQLAIRLEYEALLLGFDDDQDDEADGDDWVDLLSVGVTWTF